LGLVKSSGSIEFGFFLDKNYSQIGYCSQTPPIFSGSISSNLFLDSGIPSNLDKELIVAIEKMLMLPLQHQVTEGGRNVSGGQRVRIGIARAIFSARPVLIFDEPTNGQDADTVQRIIDMLDIVKLDRIIIVVSHDPRLISIADNLIDLDR
jgi:ABC-type multidrug transport system fused ATPase/permease subunit